jgi:hypothetical protein
MSWYIGITIKMLNCNIGLSFAKITDLYLFNEHKNKKNSVDILIELNNDTYSISDFIKFTSKLPKGTNFLNSSYLITAKNLTANTETGISDPSDPNTAETCGYDCYYYCDLNSEFLYIVDCDENGDNVYQLVDT